MSSSRFSTYLYLSVVKPNGHGALCVVWDIYSSLLAHRNVHRSRTRFSPFSAQAEDPCSCGVIQLSCCSLQFLCDLLFSYVVPDCHVNECVNRWQVLFNISFVLLSKLMVDVPRIAPAA